MSDNGKIRLDNPIAGGCWLGKDGRWRLITPDGRDMRRAPYLMELHLGRQLLRDETVHHINGDKGDDRLENLQLVSHSEHIRITNPGQYRKPLDRWAKQHDECVECGTSEREHVALGRCNACYIRQYREKHGR
jgi:hypothetical protein